MAEVTEAGVTISSPQATEDQVKAAFLAGKPDEKPAEPKVEEKQEDKEPEKLTHKERRDPKARIAELVRQREITAAELRATREELDRLRLERKAEPPPQENDPKYKDYSEFVDDKVKHEAKRLIEEREHQKVAEREEFLANRVKVQMAAAYRDRIQATLEADPKFFDNVSEDMRALVPVVAMKSGETPGPLNVVAQEIFMSEVPDRLMRYFSKEKEHLRRIATMRSPRDIAREIAKIEARLVVDENTGSSAQVTAQKAVSKASPPARPVAGTPTSEGEVSAELDGDEYTRRRLLELRKARGL